MFIKSRLQKKHFAFFVIVPLLVVTAIVKVDDPVCNGKGVLASTPGMSSVRITNMESYEEYALRATCDAYFMYKYSVALSLTNDSADDVQGWIKLILRDFTEGTVLSFQYVAVEIPGESSIDVIYPVWFETAPLVTKVSEVYAETVTGDIPHDDGTGKISMNSWLLINLFKEKFREVERVLQPFNPPVYFAPDTEGGGWAE